MKPKVLAWLSKMIKPLDKFGIPILLNYKGDSSYKTVIGGLVSIVITVILLWYAWVLFITMINRQNSVINSGDKIRSLMYKLKFAFILKISSCT